MTQLLVRGDEQVIALGFGTIQQLPIAERCPPQLESRVDGVLGQTPPQGNRRALVEQETVRRAESRSIALSPPPSLF